MYFDVLDGVVLELQPLIRKLSHQFTLSRLIKKNIKELVTSTCLPNDVIDFNVNIA